MLRMDSAAERCAAVREMTMLGASPTGRVAWRVPQVAGAHGMLYDLFPLCNRRQDMDFPADHGQKNDFINTQIFRQGPALFEAVQQAVLEKATLPQGRYDRSITAGTQLGSFARSPRSAPK